MLSILTFLQIVGLLESSNSSFSLNFHELYSRKFIKKKDEVFDEHQKQDKKKYDINNKIRVSNTYMEDLKDKIYTNRWKERQKNKSTRKNPRHDVDGNKAKAKEAPFLGQASKQKMMNQN